MYHTIEDLIGSLSDMYDKDAIDFDMNNNNINLDSVSILDYYKPNIVANSVINGQIKQAQEQFKRFELSGSDLVDLLNKDDLAKLIN